MTRHLHEPANALLYKALDLPPQERQRFVADACVGDPDLLELVNTLLSRISQLDEFLETPPELPPAQRLASIAVTQSGDARAGDLAPDPEYQPIDAIAPSDRGPSRHPLVVAAAALIACALVAGSGFALWKAREADHARVFAEQRFEQSGKLASGMQAEVDAALEKAPRTARAKLMSAAQAYLGQLASVRRSTGQLEGAHQAALMSLGFGEKLLQSNPDDLRLRRQLSATRAQVGNILIEQGRIPEGLAELRKALAIREGIAAKDAGNEQAARDVAGAHSTIAAARMATADYASAEQEYKLARDTYAAQLRANPADAALLAGLIELEMARANVQNLQHHGRDAVQSLAALHTLAADANKTGADVHPAARIALLDAYIQPRGTAAQAYAAAEQALAELLKQSEKDPLDTDQLRDSALAWQRTGEVGLRASQTESACRYLGLALKRYDEFDSSKRLNAIDKLQQVQLQALRKACG